MSFFDDIEVENLGLDEDKVGGQFAKVDKTGFNEMTITKAYVGEYDSGAKYIVLSLEREDKAKLSWRGIVSSGKAKGCKSYYLDKDGNKKNLPDYNKMKALDELLTGSNRPYPALTKGIVMMYDADLKSEKPEEKLVINEWIGKKVGTLVKKKIEDDYSDETKPRTLFEIDHFLDINTGRTRNEIVAGKSGFKDKWLSTYKEDYIQDIRVKSKDYVEGSDTSDKEEASADSWFND